MTTTLIWVGETKEPFCKQGESLFMERLGHYGRVRRVVVKAEKLDGRLSESQAMAKEGERILDKVPPQALLVVLDRQGQVVSSEGLSEKLASWQNQSIRELVFVIGGPLGLSESVLNRADWRWSLSALTFTHEMARLILLEQLYRAHTILRGEKYHK